MALAVDSRGLTIGLHSLDDTDMSGVAARLMPGTQLVANDWKKWRTISHCHLTVMTLTLSASRQYWRRVSASLNPRLF